MQNLWERALALLQKECAPTIFNSWFKNLSVEEMGDENSHSLTIVTPSRVHVDFLSQPAYKEKIKQALAVAAGAPVEVKIIYKKQDIPPVGGFGSENPNNLKLQEVTETEKYWDPKSIEKLALKSGLHQGLTFESFVSGKANMMALGSAHTVADYPGTQYNPLFIYGGVGLGKTHLMHAVGRRILENDPNTRLLCVSAERLVQDVVNLSIGGKASEEKVQQFDKKYRSLDALLIDDVQFLADKGGTQRRLFGIFEALLPANKQIILTCDSYATSLQQFDERLISRFTKGLSVAIEPAEFELRAAILHEKARQRGKELPDDVAFLIATRINTNIRELEGALNNVLMLADFQNSEITEDIAKEALKNIVATPRMTVANIQKVVSDHFNIKIGDMLSKKKTANIAYPRQIAMYLSKELTQKSLVDIGNEFGGRDHATVIYAVRKINKDRAVNQELNHSLHLIEQKLKHWS